jgi:hypothetical protein
MLGSFASFAFPCVLCDTIFLYFSVTFLKLCGSTIPIVFTQAEIPFLRAITGIKKPERIPVLIKYVVVLIV